MRLESVRGQGGQVQPFPWRLFECSVVEVEPVDMDEGAHRWKAKKARTSEEALRPVLENHKGCWHQSMAPRDEDQAGSSQDFPQKIRLHRLNGLKTGE